MAPVMASTQASKWFAVSTQLLQVQQNVLVFISAAMGSVMVLWVELYSYSVELLSSQHVPLIFG